jgi:tRNA-specific 2-thiouridylase
VLSVLTSELLAHALFPLGDSTKIQVRIEAARPGLADEPDSHDVCFIPDGDTRSFSARRLGSAPGRLVDTNGQVVGEHDGTSGFTVGQGGGMRIGRPAPDGRPRYVLDIEPVSRTVTVGPVEALGVTEITAERPLRTGCPPRALPVTVWSASAVLPCGGTVDVALGRSRRQVTARRNRLRPGSGYVAEVGDELAFAGVIRPRLPRYAWMGDISARDTRDDS